MAAELKIGDLIILGNKTPLFITNRFPMKRFECKEENHNKFWEVWQDGKMSVSRWGVLGTKGQFTEKLWKDSHEAKHEIDKLVREKLKKGYKQINPNEESFFYVFNAPVKNDAGLLSSFDIEPYLKRHNGIIQRKKVV